MNRVWNQDTQAYWVWGQDIDEVLRFAKNLSVDFYQDLNDENILIGLTKGGAIWMNADPSPRDEHTIDQLNPQSTYQLMTAEGFEYTIEAMTTRVFASNKPPSPALYEQAGEAGMIVKHL